jgi:putative Mg2+ transporter-C (MgtC) family protein
MRSCGWPVQEIRSDGYSALPQLWVQFHGYLSSCRPGRRCLRPSGVRSLPVQPLVLPPGLDPALLHGAAAELALLIRLAAAGMLAAVLGWERESARKPAGLRTHMLVGVASALFTVLGELAVVDYPAEGGLRADPIRVIQAVAIGIGFLGSGVIFVARDGEHVVGLTTAASVWATAAVGIAAGLGHYVLAAGSTIILVVVLRAMARFDRDS